MKISILILFVGVFSISATVYSQDARISFSLQDNSINDVFTAIKEQTDYSFWYDVKDVDVTQHVSLSAENETVKTVLSQTLKDQNVDFTVYGNHIIIAKKGTFDAMASQQEITITGTVTDTDNIPLPGVNVMVKGTRQGMITDVNGNYSIQAPDGNAILTFSYVGFTMQEILVGNRRTIHVILSESTLEIDEVVVIGYGTVIKKNLSTAVSTVKSDQLTQRASATNILQGMAGKVAGVSIVSNSGVPSGGNSYIKIRGTGSLNTSNLPLYVVDGVVGVDPVNIDPSIIKSVDILKDATSSAIYGARGANGVVVITTKEGRKNTSEISYSGNVSMGTLARKVDVLNAAEDLEIFKQAYEYKPGRIAPHLNPDNNFARKADIFNPDGTPKYNTDWQKETTQQAISMYHSLTFTGGSEKMTAVANVSYRDNQGIMRYTYYNQLNAFVNISWDMKSWFNLQAVINAGNSKERKSENNISRYMLEALPFLPVQYPDGTYSRKGDYPGAEDTENPIKILKEREDIDDKNYVLANFIGTFKITPYLKFTTTFSKQVGGTLNSFYAPRTLYGYGQNQRGRASRTNSSYMNWTNEDYLTFDKAFERHHINAVAGASWYSMENTRTQTGAEDFYDDFFKYNNLGVGTVRTAPSSDYGDTRMNSYYTRLNYNFDDRYLLTASFRVDGSSRFGRNNKYGFFPSFSTAWRFSNESFFEEARSIFNDAKIRLSYGSVGNAELSNYVTLNRYANSQQIFNEALESSVTLSQLGNANLRWERANQLDIALDLSAFKDRIELIVEFYNKITKDLLYSKGLPRTTGYNNAMDNLGSIRNRGVELTLHTQNIKKKDFSWNTSIVYHMNRSKVLNINGDKIYPWGGRIIEGEPMNQLFGYVRLGTWGTHEAEEAAKYGKVPGDLKYADLNNNGQKDSDDRAVHGNGMPKWEGNMLNTFEYKGIVFMFDLQAFYGNSIVNFTRQLMENRVTFSNSYRSVLNAWRPDNQDTYICSIRLPGDGYENDVDSWSTEKGSFLRVRNISLGYNFQRPLLARLKLNSLGLFFNIENALLFTEYKGGDPEVTSYSADREQGVDMYTYPKPRTYSLKVNISF